MIPDNNAITYDTTTNLTKKTIKMRFKNNNKIINELERDPEVGTIWVDGDYVYADVGLKSKLVENLEG